MVDKQGVIEKGILLTVAFGLIAFGWDTLMNWNGDYMQVIMGVVCIVLAIGLFAFWQFWTERQTVEEVIEIYSSSIPKSEEEA